MNDIILQRWQFDAKTDANSLIIPDGCRDLIFKVTAGKKPLWQITSLDDTAYKMSCIAGDFFMGYRLRPGILIDEFAILSVVKNLEPGKDRAEKQIENALKQFCSTSKPIEQALAHFGSAHANVNLVASDIGIGLRSLQRLIRQKTTKPASFWIGLARSRRAARELALGGVLAQTAFDFGYSDQSHMSRDIRRWFGVSPGEIKYHRRIVVQLNQIGFN